MYVHTYILCCLIKFIFNLLIYPNSAFSFCRSRVNGQLIAERTMVRHGYRILLGNNHLFRLSCPCSAGQVVEDYEAPVEYEQAMREISINELTDGEFYYGLAVA